MLPSVDQYFSLFGYIFLIVGLSAIVGYCVGAFTVKEKKPYMGGVLGAGVFLIFRG